MYRYIILSFALLFLISACAPNPIVIPTPSTAKMEITFIDVGQGDAEYIVLPSGKNALIDGGPSTSSLSTFMNQKGVTKIDYVVLTHPHPDHYEGLNYVFDQLQVNNFYDTQMNNTGTFGDETLRSKAATEPGCTTFYPGPGDTLNLDPDVTIKVLRACPNPAFSNQPAVINDSSIAIKITCHDKSILLTGDIESAAETSLNNTFGAELKCDVLKVAHHGANSSTIDDFLDLAKPSTAYIEIGRNTYGYGHPDVLHRLSAHGVIVHRTDQEGTMTINF